MKIRLKIRVALLLIFTAVMLLGIVASYYLDYITDKTVNTIQENSRTMKYSQEMSLALGEIITTLALEDASWSFRRTNLRKAFDRFERNLDAQSEFVLARQEQDITSQIEEDFELLRGNIARLDNRKEFSTGLYTQTINIQELLNDVYKLNEKKNELAQVQARATAELVNFWITIIGFFFLCFVLFSLYYFPGYIADPLRTLQESIGEVTRKNYSTRVETSSQDEFGELAISFNQMAEKLYEYEKTNLSEILNQKQQIETLIDAMSDPVLGLDMDKSLLFVNEAAQKLMGINEATSLGQPIAVVATLRPIVQHLVKELLEGSVHNSMRYPSLTIDEAGKQLHFSKEVIVVERPDSSGQGRRQVGYLLILKNITELKEQDIAKTEFMSTLSHELKTPIAAIDLSVNLLEDPRMGEMNEDQMEMTQTIRFNTHRLLKLVNEVLDISKIESGNIQLDYEDIHPSVLVEKAFDNVVMFVKQKQLKIEKLWPANELPLLSVDVQKTIGVLTNFLTNAIRYSPVEGILQVNIEQQKNQLIFSVKDFGPGITEKEQDRIFQRYRRVANDKTTGTGLGLAISKDFIEAQGGKIWMESSFGEGSRFCFSLPITRS